MPPTSKRRGSASSSLRSKRSRTGGGGDYEIRSLEPVLLTRGMSSRYLAGTPLPMLTNDELDRDLRHMEAYANACTAYAQQLYLYTNHVYHQQHAGGTTASSASKRISPTTHHHHKPPAAMPVRIDPEEEKRLSNLRKRIAIAEAEREVLETEYVSLTASFVHESKLLEQTRQFTDGHLQLLQELLQKRGKVLALQRVRCAMARDIQVCLETRTRLSELPKGSGSLQQRGEEKDDVLDVWNDVESQLKEAERDCRSLETEWTRTFKNHVVPWESQTKPRTPRGVPVFVSQLSRVPDRGGAFGCNGMFGSDKSSMCWLLANLPKSSEALSTEVAHVRKIEEEEHFLRSELEKEHDSNKELQREIGIRRRRNDELCTMMALLRSETEALVHRHNVLLDTPEARAVSQELHSKAVDEREQEHAAAQQESMNADKENDENAPHMNSSNSNGNDEYAMEPQQAPEDLDHDGDDEGETEEDDDQVPPNEVEFRSGEF